MQTTFPLRPLRAFAGMHADTYPSAFISRALSTRQLVELTFGTADGTYTVTINGVEVANFVAATKTATQIRDAIAADLAASAAPVIATPSSTNKLLLENAGYEAAFTIAIPTIAGYTSSQTVPQGQVAPFGAGVVRDDGAAVSGKQCRLPRLAADVTLGGFLGVLASNTAKMPANGWPDKSMPDIMRAGHIYVLVEGTGIEGAGLFMRFATGAGGSQLGAFRGDADSGTAVAVPGMRALETWTTGGIVLAELQPQTA
ncbi:MAG TPA: hypothetical protein VGO53_16125 [Steroidobacteraceae bacterium]|jgi:hypothetical protein|nr:hypothetical protein [Steroidobacteraceae bacterium]